MGLDTDTINGTKSYAALNILGKDKRFVIHFFIHSRWPNLATHQTLRDTVGCKGGKQPHPSYGIMRLIGCNQWDHEEGMFTRGHIVYTHASLHLWDLTLMQ